MKTRKLFHCIFYTVISNIIIFPHVSFCQSNFYEFDHYTTNDGLSHGYINSIFQDRKGFLWFATARGLDRFDGLSFKVYLFNEQDTNSISSDEINSLVEDTMGNIWIGTGNNICLYNREKDIFSRKIFRSGNKEYSKLSVVSTFIDSKGYLWLGTRGESIFRFKVYDNPGIYGKNINADAYSLNEDDVLPENKNSVYSFIEDYKGIIWVASYSNKLYRFDALNNKFIPFPVQHPEAMNMSKKQKFMISDHEGNFFITTEYFGLMEWKRNENKFILFKPNGTNSGTLNDFLFGIAEDKDGLIWIGSRNGGGINIFNKKTGQFTYCLNDETNPNSINSNAITYIYRDRSGSIWIGTGNNKGINKYSPYKKKFNRFYFNPQQPEGLNCNNVLCFEESRDRDIWIGTDGGGLNKYNRETGKFKHYTANPSIPGSISSNAIISLVEDNEGTLWFGTFNGGLGKMTGNKFYAYYPVPSNPYSINNKHTWYVFEDSKNNLWVATLNLGLNLFDRKTGRFYHYNNNKNDTTSLINDVLLSIFEDSRQRLYITSYQGVSVIDLNAYDFTKMPPDLKFHNLIHNKNNNSLSSNGVYCVTEDKERNLWFGTISTGIDELEFKSDKFINYSTKDGLPGNSVNAILMDNENNLWLATDKGLVKFNPATKQINVFDRKDGLQNMDFNGWALKTKDGEMYFSGPDGFNSFYPERIQYNSNKPPVVITNFKILNQPVKINEKIDNKVILTRDISETKFIELTYKEDFISFEFIALDYTIPEKNQYEYMMEGFDKDWIKCGSKREATYTNLDPHKYTFRVKASNNDGIWNDAGASIDIVILPPWWATWWFRISLIVFIIGSAVIFYLVRINALKKQKIELENKVNERTAELREANQVLSEQKEEILTQNEEILQQTEELALQKEELEKMYKNLQILGEFGQHLTATLSLSSINQMIYDYVTSLMDTSAFGIGIFNAYKNQIEYPAFIEKGIFKPFFTIPTERENSLAIWCFNNRKEIFINNYLNEYQNYIPEKGEFKTTDIPLSVIYLPLLVENKPIGVITVQSYTEYAYSNNDFNILQTLASYISIALANANAYEIIQTKNKHINNSLEYARTIQRSILPQKDIMDKEFESIIIYRPKDIVSGDFYWYQKLHKKGVAEKNFLAVVDCTGHGVPGAFMSLIGNRLLTEIINEKGIYDPSQILEFLNLTIQVALRQDATDNNDGMDVCLCCIENPSKEPLKNRTEIKLTYAGAKRPLYVFRNKTGTIEKIEGNRKSIGGFRAIRSKVDFSNKHTIINKDDIIYLTSDGFIDQNNNERNKYGTIRFVKLLNSIGSLPLEEQKQKLEQELNKHQKREEQRDDITIFGIKFC